MIRTFVAAIALLSAMSLDALADPIEGKWRTAGGATALIGPCGASLCVKLMNRPYNGRSIGRFKATGKQTYAGTLTDPDNGKTYSGKAKLSGKTLRMSGCVLGGLICRSERWRRL